MLLQKYNCIDLLMAGITFLSSNSYIADGEPIQVWQSCGLAEQGVNTAGRGPAIRSCAFRSAAAVAHVLPLIAALHYWV